MTTLEYIELTRLEHKFVTCGLSEADNALRHKLAAKLANDPIHKAKCSALLDQSEADHYRQYVR
jgi:hypothetical protein